VTAPVASSASIAAARAVIARVEMTSSAKPYLTTSSPRST